MLGAAAEKSTTQDSSTLTDCNREFSPRLASLVKNSNETFSWCASHKSFGTFS